jgi:uncharacterized protein YdeI (YjbR/CyaY-like superfamily)
VSKRRTSTAGRPSLDDLERVPIAAAAELRVWLERNHGQEASVWIVTAKKISGLPHVPWSAIVDEALCFGWIDSLPRKLDETRTMLLLSPRRAGSGWSRINKDKVERLEAEGRLAPAGRAAIVRSKADGGWDRLDAAIALIEPPDLAAALDALPAARLAFEGFSPSSRRGILEWIVQAKRPETRRKRIELTVELAARGEKANHPVRTSGLARP